MGKLLDPEAMQEGLSSANPSRAMKIMIQQAWATLQEDLELRFESMKQQLMSKVHPPEHQSEMERLVGWPVLID